MTYELRLHRDVEKQLRRIPAKQRERLVQAMRSLRDEPRPSSALRLDDLLYRLRVGQYRMVYAVFEKQLIVFVCRAARRTEATYRDLQQLLDRARREVNDNE